MPSCFYLCVPSYLGGEDGGRKKRRAALVFGYLGTQYFGLQKSIIESDELRTVEGVLEKALYDAGYIRDSNYGDLDKVGGWWSPFGLNRWWPPTKLHDGLALFNCLG